ncbi:Na-translocating system protein MpsC family protein [Mastigocoleus testarum]|uniref:Na+-translocating membrane potential-generating system MpsC domain-containing protein n=1 Tax=Mastigocoleus testarum BC008 TaxID=371196 RepID=A0A0V7ZZP3_9CYAN|nr:Na-translocating system protein MpsC family protein [Mastigocoleus testarum]KST69994.1 hypothetical protein BC008_06035 [Mastigocoleus testarum BC008]
MNNVEQVLSQKIHSLFWNELKHKPSEIRCRLYENQLTITIKDALTKPEQLLILNGYAGVAKEVRESIEQILQPRLKKIIEETIEIKISELLFATHPESDYISLIALMTVKPEVKTTPKIDFINSEPAP